MLSYRVHDIVHNLVTDYVCLDFRIGSNPLGEKGLKELADALAENKTVTAIQ